MLIGCSGLQAPGGTAAVGQPRDHIPQSLVLQKWVLYTGCTVAGGQPLGLEVEVAVRAAVLPIEHEIGGEFVPEHQVPDVFHRHGHRPGVAAKPHRPRQRGGHQQPESHDGGHAEAVEQHGPH